MTSLYTHIINRIIKIGLFLLPLSAFLVAGGMFFPYITLKNFFFRIVVEIIFALWAMLAITDKRFRPSISPLLYAITITVLVLGIAAAFGENPYRSFWSNYERMEGVIGHLHLFAYFLVLISMFKTERDWRRFFYVLAGTGASMALYGWAQLLGLANISIQSGARVDGSFGNATYMAIFMVFQAFLALYFFLRSERSWLKAVFLALFALEAPVIFFTATRGSILGFLGGALLLSLLLAFFSKNYRLKYSAFGVMAGILVLVGLFWTLRDSDFVKNNYVLTRFSDLSIHERTVESRFTIWNMSWQGFKEKPILGWGIENYNLVFNKYYQPEMWKQEPWFDRSHNVVFDWLISAGLLGFLAYMSIFASALYILWRKLTWRPGLQLETGSPSYTEAVVFTSLLAAYFFHNLFVFDNLISYYLFFSVLGFIHFRYEEPGEAVDGRQVAGRDTRELGLSQMLAITAVFIGLLLSLYFANIKPVLANKALLSTLQDIQTKGLDADVIISDFEKVFAYRTFGTGEAREQLSGYANNLYRSNAPAEAKQKALIFAIKELKKQVDENPKDARGYLFLSALYQHAGQLQESLSIIDKALELSPKKQQIYFLLADVYMAMGNFPKAMEVMRIAYDLDRSYEEAAMGLTITAIVAGEQELADAILKERFGKVIVPDQKLINAYAKIGNYERMAETWKAIIERSPGNAQYHVNLAATYMHLGERQKAIQEIERAIEINPEFKQQGEYFINEIKAGRNP